MNGQAFIEPKAAWKITLDGKDLADKIAPRIVSLTLSERRNESADELELVLHDHDGKLALPAQGAVLAISLGWEKGTGVTPGLVDKGSFKVDEMSWEGPPDKVTIRARSADMGGNFRTRKSRTWHGKTLGAIVKQIAADNKLTPRCHADLASKMVTSAEQANKSDMEFLRDLGRRYDAVATVKNKSLIFSPIDATTTATGKEIGTIKLTRSDGDSYRYQRAARENGQDGAEAQWHDQASGKRKKVQEGGSNRRRLKRVYSSESDAKAAARAEASRLKRAGATMEITKALGDASIAAGMKATATGFKDEIDKQSWKIANVRHCFDDRGFRTELEMEVAG